MRKCIIRLFVSLFPFVFAAIGALAQGSFAYQTVIMDSKGDVVCNKTVGMRFTLMHNSIAYYQESQSPHADEYGNISVMIGSGTIESGSFMSVPWNTMEIMMQIEVSIDNNSNYVNMGTMQIQSVPYAMYAATYGNEVSPFANASSGSSLFSVKDKNGDVVFAVYEDGVEVYIDENSSKAAGRGFSICGREATKAGETGSLFTVGGDGTTVYVDTEGSKAVGRGFSICRREPTKSGVDASLFTVNDEGTKVFVDDASGKAAGRGFSICGREATKDGNNSSYLTVDGGKVNVSAGSFNVYDPNTDSVVIAVTDGVFTTKSDVLVQGDVLNVADYSQHDEVYNWKIPVEYDNVWNNYSINFDHIYGDDMMGIPFVEEDSIVAGLELYGFSLATMMSDGSLLKSNGGKDEVMYFDEAGFAIANGNSSNIQLKKHDAFFEITYEHAVLSKDVDVNFCLYGTIDNKTVLVNCTVTLKGDGNGGSGHQNLQGRHISYLLLDTNGDCFVEYYYVSGENERDVVEYERSTDSEGDTLRIYKFEGDTKRCIAYYDGSHDSQSATQKYPNKPIYSADNMIESMKKAFVDEYENDSLSITANGDTIIYTNLYYGPLEEADLPALSLVFKELDGFVVAMDLHIDLVDYVLNTIIESIVGNLTSDELEIMLENEETYQFFVLEMEEILMSLNADFKDGVADELIGSIPEMAGLSATEREAAVSEILNKYSSGPVGDFVIPMMNVLSMDDDFEGLDDILNEFKVNN